MAEPSVRAQLREGGLRQFYINGDPSARIAYLNLEKHLYAFLGEMFGASRLGFRPPTTLRQWAALVEVQLGIVTGMFKISGHTEPVVGGRVRRVLIPWPRGLRRGP